MQLIILIFLSLYTLNSQNIKNIKKDNNPPDIGSLDPYDSNLIFDPSIPNKSPTDFPRIITHKRKTSNFHFVILPRLIYTKKYLLLGQESVFMFSKKNETYTNFSLNKEYKDAEIYTRFNMNKKYYLNFKIKYQKASILQSSYDKTSFLSTIKLKRSIFSQIGFSAGVLFINNIIWPSFALTLGKSPPPLSYNSYKSFFWINTFIYSKIKESAFFKTDINYKFAYLLSSRSIINICLKYLYSSIDTPVFEKIRLGNNLRAYNLFKPIDTKKLFYISPSYSLLLSDRVYFSFLYEAGFLINSLGDISTKTLKSSYSIELGYISKSLEAVKYFIYYAIGENSNHKLMFGIKY